MADSNADEAREALLAEAAQAWWDDPALDAQILGGDGGDNVSGFLHAYYLRVAAEDLAPPARLAAVAESHARLGLGRPQGRALVQVREPGSAHLVLVTPSSLVVDIVTDDMPYLVDSVITELNRHEAEISLLVHPLLRVCRDVTGMLRGVLGVSADDADPPDVEADELVESWIHVEIGPPRDRVTADELAADLRHVLDDVRVAVEDQERMAAVADLLADDLDGEPGSDEAEYGELLRWLADGNFLFLGYRQYDLVQTEEGTHLRAVPGTGLGILRHHRKGRAPLSRLSPQVAARAQDPSEHLVLAKANSRSTVYRANYLDYVSVKKRDSAGIVTGEFRFLGLYTHSAHTQPISDIPVLRRKLAQVLATAGLSKDSHDGKDLVEILEDYPREELFEISAEELTPIALGVLRLSERRQTRLFLRRDRYGRYMSCLVYLPRDRYTTPVRLRAQSILKEALDGTSVDYSAQVGDSALARLHVVIRGEPGRPIPQVDGAALERRLAEAVRSWDEDLAVEATHLLGEERAAKLLDMCSASIPETYKTDVSPDDAVDDLSTMVELRESGKEYAVRLVEDPERWTLVIYRLGTPITLSDVLPQLQHMGLEVVDEHPYKFTGTGDNKSFWVYEFGLRAPANQASGSVREIFEAALTALWQGQTEDDGFNTLVLAAGLGWREINLLRACAKYLRQGGMRFSEDYVQRVLRSNPAITRLLVRLFESRFDPARQDGVTERCEAIAEEIRGQLDEVVSLDADRILRQYLALIDATLRTNYYRSQSPGSQAGPRPLVLKLNARAVPGLAEPRPMFEIFVYSPRLEAVHLRFGRVARGGLRWSDRQEDFRTEVLGLVKAQEVKNAVFVPSGAKGGFVCKRLPDPSDREAYQAEVLACYKTFIAAMLDVTDNIAADAVVPPPDVVRRDNDDPYLVVAADKGTATFSDIANGISLDYGFWLGDAFASGGTAGYDHKKMGITARGAWESVKRHFREIGADIQKEPFSVVGVGDMSGDVFGNAMLLSPQIRLVAAFNHQHIFIDPDPDPAVSLAERRRLFDLPRSGWNDYDAKLLSPGGAVYERKAKSVRLSPEAKRRFAIDKETLTPAELVRTLLAAEVDLLWLGGIGTYVKAHDESNFEAGDRANDTLRVDARDLRCKVVGEGANLGFTQRGRIEASMAGRRINTDAIDNSAGVDTSDHEVNIKIALNDMVAAGDMTVKQRDRLLQEMTEDVARLVLRDNYLQTQALSAQVQRGWFDIDRQGRCMRTLERAGLLDRAIEFLPDDETIRARLAHRQGLARPELCVLLAYAKMTLYEELLPSDLPDDPQLEEDLLNYFPKVMRERSGEAIRHHRLRREIIATVVTNSIVNRMGPTFVHVMKEKTGLPASDVARGYAICRGAFELRRLWAEIRELDNQVPAACQYEMLEATLRLGESGTLWCLRNLSAPLDIADNIAALEPGLAELAGGIKTMISEGAGKALAERGDQLVKRGVPTDLASHVASLDFLEPGPDIVRLARQVNHGVSEVAGVYFTIGRRFHLDWLRSASGSVNLDTHWDRLAVAAIVEDLYAHQRDVAASVLRQANGAGIEEWVATRPQPVQRVESLIADLRRQGGLDLAKLAVANRELRGLAGG